ncbi:MAG: helix-turn-helix domain-containing protein [Chloroflexota bacterium]
MCNPIESQILEAAQTLLTEVGYGFTMAQLEAKANVSRATIYRHIGNKEKLVARLARDPGKAIRTSGSRLRILNAARIIFGRVGMVAATMEQIAAEAGVGVATVYRQFGDKDSLVQAFAEEMTPRAAVRSRVLNPTADLSADLEALVSFMLPFFYENRDMLRMVLMGNETERYYFERLRDDSDSTLARLTEYFEHQLAAKRVRQVGNARELALALLGMILSFAVIGPLHYRIPLEDPEQHSKFIVRLFLNDLREDSQ